MIPGEYSLELYRGDSASWSFVLWNDIDKTDPTDLTGQTPKAQIRSKFGGVDVINMDCSITSNTINVRLEADVWLTFPSKFSVAQWDLQLTGTDGEVKTVLAGSVKIIPDITDSVVVP